MESAVSWYRLSIAKAISSVINAGRDNRTVFENEDGGMLMRHWQNAAYWGCSCRPRCRPLYTAVAMPPRRRMPAAKQPVAQQPAVPVPEQSSHLDPNPDAPAPGGRGYRKRTSSTELRGTDADPKLIPSTPVAKRLSSVLRTPVSLKLRPPKLPRDQCDSQSMPPPLKPSQNVPRGSFSSELSSNSGRRPEWKYEEYSPRRAKAWTEEVFGPNRWMEHQLLRTERRYQLVKKTFMISDNEDTEEEDDDLTLFPDYKRPIHNPAPSQQSEPPT